MAQFQSWRERYGYVDYDEETEEVQPLNPETPEANDSWEITKGIKSGVDQLQGIGGGLVGVVGDVIGVDRLRDWGLESYRKNMEEAQLNQARVKSYDEIENVGDAVAYAMFGIGNALPMFAPTLVSGGVGAIAARKATQAAVTKLVEKKFAEGVATGLTERAALKLAANVGDKAAARGFTAGAVAGGSGLETGSIYGEVFDETGEHRPGVALSFGTVAGAIDAMPMGAIFKRMGIGKKAKDEIMGKIQDGMGTFIGKQFLKEATTEGVQTVIERAAIKWVDENKDIFTEEGWKEITNATILGGIAGGGIAAPTSLMNRQSKEEKAAIRASHRKASIESDTNKNLDDLMQEISDEVSGNAENNDLGKMKTLEDLEFESVGLDELKTETINREPEIGFNYEASEVNPVDSLELEPLVSDAIPYVKPSSEIDTGVIDNEIARFEGESLDEQYTKDLADFDKELNKDEDIRSLIQYTVNNAKEIPSKDAVQYGEVTLEQAVRNNGGIATRDVEGYSGSEISDVNKEQPGNALFKENGQSTDEMRETLVGQGWPPEMVDPAVLVSNITDERLNDAPRNPQEIDYLDISKRINTNSTRYEVKNTLDKYLAGEKLTANQQRILDEVYEIQKDVEKEIINSSPIIETSEEYDPQYQEQYESFYQQRDKQVYDKIRNILDDDTDIISDMELALDKAQQAGELTVDDVSNIIDKYLEVSDGNQATQEDTRKSEGRSQREPTQKQDEDQVKLTQATVNSGNVAKNLPDNPKIGDQDGQLQRNERNPEEVQAANRRRSDARENDPEAVQGAKSLKQEAKYEPESKRLSEQRLRPASDSNDTLLKDKSPSGDLLSKSKKLNPKLKPKNSISFNDKTFNRGDWVQAIKNDKDKTFFKAGKVEGISHKRNEVKINSVWHDVGSVESTEKPVSTPVKKTALSKIIESNNKKTGAEINESDLVPNEDGSRLKPVNESYYSERNTTLDEVKKKFKDSNALNTELVRLSKLGRTPAATLQQTGFNSFRDVEIAGFDVDAAMKAAEKTDPLSVESITERLVTEDRFGDYSVETEFGTKNELSTAKILDSSGKVVAQITANEPKFLHGFHEQVAKEIHRLINKKSSDSKKILDPRLKPKSDTHTGKQIDELAKQTNTNPSDAQIEADNYKKASIKVHGLDIKIENPKGSTRSGTDPNGKDWSVTMKHHYGDIKGFKGADGDDVDVFIGGNPKSDNVFIINQIEPKSLEFDELKVILGVENSLQAMKVFVDSFDGSGHSRVGSIYQMNADNFKRFLKDGKGNREIKRESGISRKIKTPTLQDLELYAKSNKQSKRSTLSQLRGKRNKGSSRTDDVLEVSGSGRGKTDSASSIRQDRQQRGLLPRESTLVNKETASAEYEKKSSNDRGKGDKELNRVGRSNEPSSVNDTLQTVKRNERGSGDNDTSKSQRKGKIETAFDLKKTTGKEGGIKEKNSVYFVYERESNDLPSKRNKRNVSEPKGRPKKTTESVFIDSQATEKETKQQLTDVYKVRVEAVPVTHLKSPLDVAISSEDIAAVIADIGKKAQEVFIVIATDDKGKILRVMRHSSGQKNSSSVDPMTVIAEVASIKGAAIVHFSHNHPSGAVKPSNADINITNKLVDMLSGTGIRYGKHVITGGGKFSAIELGGGSREITPTKSKELKTIPVTDRQFSEFSPGMSVTSSRDSIELSSSVSSENALFLLDSSSQHVGTVFLSGSEMKKLRDGESLNRILKAINTTNASSALIKTNSDNAAKNIVRFARNMDGFRVLDWIHQQQGRYVSDMEQGGASLSSTGPFLRVGQDYKPMPLRQSQKIAAEMSKEMPYAKFNMVNAQKDLPVNILMELNARDIDGVKGVIKGDSIYIVASNHNSVNDIRATILHEVVGHYGLKKLLGKKEHGNFMDKVWDSISPKEHLRIMKEHNFAKKGKALKKKYGESVSQKMTFRMVADEYVAEIAESGSNPTVLDRIVVFFKDALRKIFPDMAISDSDIKVALARTKRFLKEKGQTSLSEISLTRKVTDKNGNVVELEGSAESVKKVLYSKMNAAYKLMECIRG